MLILKGLQRLFRKKKNEGKRRKPHTTDMAFVSSSSDYLDSSEAPDLLSVWPDSSAEVPTSSWGGFGGGESGGGGASDTRSSSSSYDSGSSSYE